MNKMIRPPSPTLLAKTIAGHDQQLRHLNTEAPWSWDNFRWEIAAGTCDSSGFCVIQFLAPFPEQCFIVLPQVVSGGWFCALQNWTPAEFRVWIGDLSGASHVGGTQVAYLALGS